MKKLLIKIEEKRRKLHAGFSLPENWDEVPADIYPHLASLYLATDDQMDKYSRLVRAFASLAWRHWKVISLLEDAELYELLKLIDWVFDKLDLRKNHLPVIKAGRMQLYGPANGLENLRFGEWCYADTYMVAYAKTKDVEMLNRLVATIYRPKGEGPQYKPGKANYRGDIRQKFNDQLTDERLKHVEQLPIAVRQGIYLWFVSCRFQLVKQFPHVFAEKTEGEAAGTAKENNTGWMGVYDDLRGDPKFGGAEKLEEEFLNSVLFSLERSTEKMLELKAKYEL